MPITPAGIRDRKPPPDAPPEGRFRVAICVERPDGQFVTSSRLIPSDVLSWIPEAQAVVTTGIAAAFVSTYQRAAELPG